MAPIPDSNFAWIKNFIKSNPLITAWNAVLLFGGCILLFFHTGLTYLPDFNSTDLAGLLASVTLIGLLLIATLMVGCFFPGLVLRWVENDFSRNKEQLFGTKKERLLLFSFATILWAFYFIVPNEWYPDILLASPSRNLFIALATLSLGGAFYIAKTTPACWLKPVWKSTWLRIRAFGLLLWGIMLLFPFGIATIFAAAGEVNFEHAAGILIGYLLLLFNLIVYALPRREIRYAIPIGALLIGIVTPLIVGHFLFLPKLIMETLALGNKKAAVVTISGKQCYTLARLGVTCDITDIEKGAIELQNVNVLSRIGTSMLLELLVAAKSNENKESQATPYSGTLNIGQNEKSMYCPSSKSRAEGCSQCDDMLLQRLTSKLNQDQLAKMNAYKQNLVCIRLSIPKSEIYNFSLTSGRSYKDFTSFTLPLKGFKNVNQKSPN